VATGGGLACEFLRVAERDYEAAKCLLRNGFYPQGLFLLQQALEKELKAPLVALGADKEELKKKLGHTPIGGFCKIWKKPARKLGILQISVNYMILSTCFVNCMNKI